MIFVILPVDILSMVVTNSTLSLSPLASIQMSSSIPFLIAGIVSEQESKRVVGNDSDKTAHFLVGRGLILHYS